MSNTCTLRFDAFNGCTALKEVYFPKNITAENGVFNECTNLGTINVSSDNKNLYVKDGVLFRNDEAGKITLLRYPSGKNIDTYVVPEGVTHIAHDAFEQDYYLKKVIMPDSLVVLDGFDRCLALQEVVLGNKVEEVVGASFWFAESLDSINLPDSMKKIGDFAFKACKSLFSIHLADNITEIDVGAFDDCINLSLVRIPKGLTTIKQSSFSDCSSLKYVWIPRNISIIEEQAFRDSDNITDVYYEGTKEEWDKIIINAYNESLLNATIHYNSKDIPDDILIVSGTCGDSLTWEFDRINGALTISGTGAMVDCGFSKAPWYEYRSLIKHLVVDEGVTTISDYAFYQYKNLESALLPETLFSIGKESFGHCDRLKDVQLPEGLEFIEDGAFYVCDSLTNITIPASVVGIGVNPFNGCSLAKIEVDEDNPYYYSDQYGVLYFTVDNLTVLVSYPSASPLTEYTAVEDVYAVGDCAFAWAENLEKIVFKDGLVEIGGEAFYCTDNLQELSLPETLTTLASGAFDSCGLKEYNLPDSLSVIGLQAFRFCDNLETITIPKNVTTIGHSPFAGCNNLKDVIVADGNEKFYFENGALYEKVTDGVRLITCITDETTFTIPEGVTEIEQSAFDDAENLKELYIPKTVKTIGRNILLSNGVSISVTDVYYDGSEADWEEININSRNTGLQAATIHFGKDDSSSSDDNTSDSTTDNNTSSGTTSSGGGSSYTPSTSQSSDDISINNTNSNLSIETSDVKASVISNAKNIASKDSSISVIGGADCAVNITAEDKQGNDVNGFFTPLTVEIPVDSAALKSVDNISHLTLAKVVTDANGNTSLVYMGGNYDTQTGLFTAYVDEPGDYVLVEDADVKKIELQIGNKSTDVNGKTITSDVAPRIIDGHTYVPLRYIAEILGCEVAWDEATRTVTITQNGITMKLVIDEEIEGYGVSAVIRENRTLVPLRYIAEMLGANVIWHPQTQEIVVVK